MKPKLVRSIIVIALVAVAASNLGRSMNIPPAAAQGTADLYMKDTPLDTGIEPNPDTGPMWVTEDIWVRTTADPSYRPQPFAEASPSWIPLPHENPEYRDPKYSSPNYVYVRVRNRGSTASNGTERLRLYWAKASTGLAWPAQWVDNVVSSGGSDTLYGAEVTKPRKNAATATQTERDAYVQAILDIGTIPAFVFPGGVSYWHMQNGIHALGSIQTIGHRSPAFFPWHREMLSRYELLLQEADPTVKLLYWDWTTDPANSTNGFDFFTNNFMGASGRGTGGTSIGAPFILPTPTPSLFPPAVSRNLSTRTTPPMEADPTPLAIGTYPPFRLRVEGEGRRNHDLAHGYIGGSGQLSSPSTAAQDPFFFLLHTNVDRLWAKWQRDTSNLSRLASSTAYGLDATNPNITINLPPWDGSSGLRPWTAADGYIKVKDSRDASLVSPPIYDTAPLVIPVLQPGEATVIQIPWYPPNPADFPSFADPGHVCLLARIETSDTPPFGMTFAEGADVGTNTRNNNNIAWKNVTVVDNFLGALRLTSALIRNVFDESVFTGLHFAQPEEFAASFFDFGSIQVDLGAELFNRWLEGGAVGQGIEPVGESTIQIFSPDAFIHNIKLEPGEMFPVEVAFELFKDYEPLPEVFPKWDLIQTGTPADPEARVGGQRFQIDLSKLVLVKTGDEWRYLDSGSAPDQSWASPDFDDSSWKLGKAPLGFGNNVETVIDGGSPDNRRITAYFRKKFEVADVDFLRTLFMRLRRNDGAAVYLNGIEIHRVNLPAGELTADTPATRDVGGLERDVFFPVEVDRALLNPGSNTIAVEIHLASSTSQDLSFDLELLANPAELRFAPDVSFAIPMNGDLIQTGDSIPIEVEALDSDGEVASVSLFADGELLGTDSDAPYSFEWQGADLGSHLLMATAQDDNDQQSLVDVSITVLENTPPSVRLTRPVGDTIFQSGEVIPISAQASDNGGGIDRVEFYLYGMARFDNPNLLVGTAEAAPYEISLTNLRPGHYMLFALAIDDGGVSSQSVPVHFDVNGTLTFLPITGR